MPTSYTVKSSCVASAYSGSCLTPSKYFHYFGTSTHQPVHTALSRCPFIRSHHHPSQILLRQVILPPSNFSCSSGNISFRPSKNGHRTTPLHIIRTWFVHWFAKTTAAWFAAGFRKSPSFAWDNYLTPKKH